MAAYSDLAGSIASHGMRALLSCSSRCRTVWDLPDPVAPVTNACRLSVDSGTRNVPTPRSWPSRISPSSSSPPVAPSFDSAVTSKKPDSSTRTPGTSRLGSPASAASAPAVAANGAAAPSDGSCMVTASASDRA